MSDDNIPRRPDGLNEEPQRTGSMPRLEVEPTPVPPTEYAAGATSAFDSTTAGTSYDQAGTASGASEGVPGGHYQQSGGGTSQQVPPVPGNVASHTHTETRTVVKTKTKKLPIFLASFVGLVAGAVLVIALVMSGVFRITEQNIESTNDPVGSAITSIKIDPEDTTLSEAVATKALPSVVSITAMDEESGEGGVGSGVILDEDGNILTNYHVIEGATTLVVSTDDGASYEAEVVGTDASSDLAVIQLQGIDDVKLVPIEVADSNDVVVGEWAMTVGSPFGNEQSVSTGIVSALYRSTALMNDNGIAIYANMIQTDAAINPGNSGGALVNAEGKLIGICSMLESYSGSSSSVGFAIPSNYAINIANQIINGDVPVHPYLGVSLTSVNAAIANREDLAVDSGAYVVEVVDDGPADEADIEPGDIVTALNGKEIASADGLIIALREHEVGEEVTLTVVRGKKELQIEVTLGSDEALQAEQEDTSDDSNSNSGGNDEITEEDIIRYFEELRNRENRP